MSDAPSLDPAAAGWKRRQHAGFLALVGPIWARREDVGWAYGFLVEPRHLNVADILHGGMLTTLVDQALSAIAWEAVGRQPLVTVQLDMQFIGSARSGDFVEMRGVVLRQTSSLLFMQGIASVAGDTVASATGIWKRLRPRGAAQEEAAG